MNDKPQKGCFVERNTGKVLCHWVAKADKPDLISHIFLGDVFAPQGKILEISVYPQKVNWVDDPEYMAAEEAALNSKRREELIRKGVEFEGEFYPATRRDQDGLTAVFIGLKEDFILMANFVFSDGKSLLLTQENFLSFARVWVPFRQTFFNEG